MFGRWKPGWIACAPLHTGRLRRGGGRSAFAGRALHACAWSMVLLFAFAGPDVRAQIETAETDEQGEDVQTSQTTTGSPYFMATPQLDSALTPLKHLPPDALVSLRSIVVTVPDPLETTMGKSFDLDVASLVSAYQARGYELDAFAFAWAPHIDSKNDGKDTGRARSTKGFDDKHRAMPSLLLFRRDLWRRSQSGNRDASQPRSVAAAPPAAYELVYLVGESPSYGIQPAAFQAAARCAMWFDGDADPVSAYSPQEPCNEMPPTSGRSLRMIAPTYSGSMESLAVALGQLPCAKGCSEVDLTIDAIGVQMISPTASVSSNHNLPQHSFIGGMQVEYASLSWTQEAQMQALVTYLCRNGLLHEKKIVFLAEESTFGQGARDLAGRLTSALGKCADETIQKNCLGDTPISIRVMPFSPNIASIRAEHFRLRKAELAARQKIPMTRGRLLELDMTSVELGSSNPPTYQPGLTTRADELMLHQRFDVLRTWVKPDVVVIIATDVRDRLFLLSEVRKALPSTLVVMLVMDYLAVHPDYRQASRGAVVLPSRDPTVCVTTSADAQALSEPELAQCTSRRLDPDPVAKCMADSDDPARVCDPSAQNEGAPHKSRPAPDAVDRYPFSTDLSANVFRAVLMLAKYRQGNADASAGFSSYVKQVKDSEGLFAPGLYVATLAGFQRVDDGRSVMVAADSRIAFAKVWYVVVALLATFYLLVGVWLHRGAKGGTAMSNFGAAVLLDSRWLTLRLGRLLRLKPPVARANPAQTGRADPPLTPRWTWLNAIIAIIGGLVALCAVIRLLQVTRPWGIDACPQADMSCRFGLTHGRDVVAMYCIWSLYACLALVGIIRLCVAARRYETYGNELGWPEAGYLTRPWLIPVVVMAVVFSVFYVINDKAVSVDDRHPWLFALLALVCSVGFLFAMVWQMSQLRRVTLWLSVAIDPIQKAHGTKKWPTPKLLQQQTGTPFNLSLEERDVDALNAGALKDWINAVKPPDASGVTAPMPLAQWQEQLVAELKVLVVAIRSAAWAAMGAPLAVLLAVSVYAPIFERWLKTMSIALLLIGFLCTIIAVLRLEKDPMLGPMFTQDGDNLTFGGGLRALWPKFLAMGVVLVPLVLPDILTWINTMIRSINSLG